MNTENTNAAKELPKVLTFGENNEWAVHHDDGCLIFHPQWNTNPHNTSTYIWREAWEFVQNQGGFDNLVARLRDIKARKYKKLLLNFAEETGVDPSFVGFQGHDFSFRGMSGAEDAAMTGAGHLTSFVGTDTVPAIDFLEDYYNANADKELVGCSVPATEHSVMTLNAKFGEGEPDEYDSFKRLITELYPIGIVSIVSDSFDFWGVLSKILPNLKEEIMARNGKVVIRPDSGDPVKIVAGYNNDEYYLDNGYFKEVGTDKILNLNEIIGAVELLWAIFGGTVTDKGYKSLDSHIGLIYGDSITLDRANEILTRLKNKGFASNNIVFGIGSYTYQYQTRDTLGFAVKATAGIVNGEVKEIFKKPKTDDGMKNSAGC